jgi:septal ring factor EnvC (AmiA/AmiB activator)
MWFAFPPGVECISVERQEFITEGKDKLGRDCFRAPDHFAPRILAIPGFVPASELVGDVPSDLTPTSPDMEKAIQQLAEQRDADGVRIQGLTEDLASLSAKLEAMTNERDEAHKQIEILHEQIENLQQELEDAGEPATAAKK